MNSAPVRKTSAVEAGGGFAPFAGLGLDMAGLRLRARLMAPVWIRPVAGPVADERGDLVPCLAGYSLLTFLGREIRGR